MSKRLRLQRISRLGVTLGMLLALVLAWSHATGSRASADEPHRGLDFSLEVQGVDGCNTRGGDTSCLINIGSTFTAAVRLNSLGGTPDAGIAVSSYLAFDFSLAYSGIDTSPETGNLTFPWTGCRIPLQAYLYNRLQAGCSFGVGGAPSSYLGVMATNDFTCTDAESTGNTLSLVHGAGIEGGLVRTDLVDPNGAAHAEGVQTQETLTINCGIVPPTPTPRATPTERAGQATPTVGVETLPPTGNGGGASSPAGDGGGATADGPAGLAGGDGVNTGLWATIGALLAAAVAGLAFFGWRYARSP